MELNRYQVVNAAECCASPSQMCKDCPMPQDVKDDCRCMETLSRKFLALIRELDKELFEAHNKNVELIKENAQLKFFDLVTAQQNAESFKKQYLEAKYEVLTDFAERLLDTKCKICNDDYIFADNVKVILSKMLTEGWEDR